VNGERKVLEDDPTDTNLRDSPYYPPRARWYSSFWRLWYPVKRWLYLDRFPKHVQYELSEPLLGLVLPGWALLWSRRPVFGVILGMTYCVSMAVFLIWRGYTVSNVALTLMITIHAGSVLRIEPSTGLLKRCFWSLCVFFALGALVYTPLIHQMEQRWFVALRVGDHVVNIRTGANPGKVSRNDWIAYRVSGGGYGHGQEAPVWVRGGCMFGRVIAVAGDEVAFHPHNVSVNGELRARLANMPTNVTIHVDQRCWFIWPEMAINNEGQVGGAIIMDAMMRLAIVPETSYIGIPYRRWFWRKQSLP
jgi:hypothetical protein